MSNAYLFSPANGFAEPVAVAEFDGAPPPFVEVTIESETLRFVLEMPTSSVYDGPLYRQLETV